MVENKHFYRNLNLSTKLRNVLTSEVSCEGAIKECNWEQTNLGDSLFHDADLCEGLYSYNAESLKYRRFKVSNVL